MQIDWQDIYNRVYEWIVQNGPGILLAVAVFTAGIFLIRIVNRWIKKGMERRRVNPSIRYFLQNLIAIILQVFLVIISLQIAGLKLTVFSAILAGLTVAAGLALSGTLQNFVSGILILFLKPYRVGDNISTQGQEGTVTSIQLFYTVILMFDNRTLIVPNGQLSNSTVMNLSREGRRRLDIDIGLGYDTDIQKVKTIIANTVSSAKQLLPDPAMRIGVSLLDKERYVMTLNVWTNAHGFNDTKLELNERIINDLKAGGIKFPGMKEDSEDENDIEELVEKERPETENRD